MGQGENTLTARHGDPYGRTATNTSSVIAQDRTYGYDLNGNMTNDGEFAYTWNNENRLVEIRRASDNTLLQKNSYDGLGRRREKVVYEGGQATTNRYIYRGWLVMAVTDGTTNILETYTHGNDLSGSFEGAGGIGGILSVSTPASTNFYLYDFNGNVAGLTDSLGQPTARYEYSPFGEVLLHLGDASARFQFSSKEFDAPIRMNYYGYRFYSPEMGRWLNRDPLGERVGVNIYIMNLNSLINRLDYLGLLTKVTVTGQSACDDEEKEYKLYIEDPTHQQKMDYWSPYEDSFYSDTWNVGVCTTCENKVEYEINAFIVLDYHLEYHIFSFSWVWVIDASSFKSNKTETGNSCCP